MKLFVRYLIMGLASASVPVALAGAPPALADCTNCRLAPPCVRRATVRGGGPRPADGSGLSRLLRRPLVLQRRLGRRHRPQSRSPGSPTVLAVGGGRPGGGGGGGRRLGRALSIAAESHCPFEQGASHVLTQRHRRRHDRRRNAFRHRGDGRRRSAELHGRRPCRRHGRRIRGHVLIPVHPSGRERLLHGPQGQAQRSDGERHPGVLRREPTRSATSSRRSGRRPPTSGIAATCRCPRCRWASPRSAGIAAG